MAYIGQDPVIGRYIIVDQISGGFNGTASGFTLAAGGQGVIPGLAQNVLLSLGGVIQQPGTDYTVSGSGITFTTPPLSGTTFFATVLGDVQAVGTPSDGTVLPASIATSGTFVFPNLTTTGTTLIASGNASTPSLAVIGDTNTGLYSPGADQVAISTNGTGRLFVDASGNIGINTSPSSLGSSVTTLEIKGGSTTRTGGLRLSSSDSSVKGAFYVYDGAGVLGTETSHPLGFYIANTERMRLDTSGRLGIGTTSPSSLLTSYAGNVSTLGAKASTGLCIENNGSVGNISQIGLGYTFSSTYHPVAIAAITDAGAGSTRANLVFAVRSVTTDAAPEERARIDSSGRLLVGTSTARSNFYNSTNSARLQIEGSGSNDNYALSIVSNYAGSTSGAQVILAKSGGSNVGDNTLVSDGNTIGQITFQGADGTDFVEAARISAEVNGTPGANDMPGCLIFSTTADGAATSAERIRINSAGRLLVGTSAAPTVGELLRVEKASTGTEGAGIRFGGSYTIADAGTQTVTVGNGALVFVSENTTGDGALFFCGYKSATVTLVADPNSRYANTVTAGRISLTKSANSLNATLTNNSGASRSFTIGKINNSD